MNPPSTARSEMLRRLRSVPLFSVLDETAVGRLIDTCAVTTFRQGRQIVMPTQQAERFFVVLSGKVRIYKLSARGDEQILHLYGPGETFGEAAMWAGICYPAHAEALSDVTLLSVSRQALRQAILRDPDLAMGMLAGLSAKLREFNLLIEQLSLKEVPARLAGALLRMMQEHGTPTFRLPATKRHLAAQIGTAAETLSRALGKLKDSGLIKMRGSEITVLDEPGLRELEESGSLS